MDLVNIIKILGTVLTVIAAGIETNKNKQIQIISFSDKKGEAVMLESESKILSKFFYERFNKVD